MSKYEITRISYLLSAAKTLSSEFRANTSLGTVIKDLESRLEELKKQQEKQEQDVR